MGGLQTYLERIEPRGRDSLTDTFHLQVSEVTGESSKHLTTSAVTATTGFDI
jgi:hypothetical protein